MFNLFLKEFDLGLMEANDIYESASDILAIEVSELSMLQEQGYFEESSDDVVYEGSIEKFMDSIKEFFKKIKDAIVNFVKNVKNKIDIEFTKRDINRRLSIIKKQMAKSHEGISRFNGKRFPYFDYIKYMRAYKKYTNQLVKEMKVTYGKNYSNVAEYESAVSECNKRLRKTVEDLKLNNVEVFTIDISVHEIIDNSEKASKDIAKIIKLYDDEANRVLEAAEDIVKKQTDVTHMNTVKSSVNSVISEITHMANTAINKTISGLYRTISAFSSLFKKNDK